MLSIQRSTKPHRHPAYNGAVSLERPENWFPLIPCRRSPPLSSADSVPEPLTRISQPRRLRIFQRSILNRHTHLVWPVADVPAVAESAAINPKRCTILLARDTRLNESEIGAGVPYLAVTHLSPDFSLAAHIVKMWRQTLGAPAAFSRQSREVFRRTASLLRVPNITLAKL